MHLPLLGYLQAAVAVVVEYLECLKKGEAVPQAKEDDSRLKRLADSEEEVSRDKSDHEDEEGYNSEEIGAAPSSGTPAWKSLLECKSKEQLVNLIRELAEKNPEVRQILEDRAGLSKGTVGRMVKSIRQEIRNLSSEPGWNNYWKGEGYTPDEP